MKKNKLLLALITFCLISAFAFSQEENIVRLKPILGQGYLVFNKTNYPNVDHWDVDIIKRSHGEGEYQDRIIEREELPQNINYMFIPVDYRRQSTAVNYLVNVRGVSSNGQTIVANNRVQLNDNNGPSFIEQRTDGSLPAQRECEVTCVSGTYAYAIAQYSFPHLPTTHLVFEQALRAFDPQDQVANAFYYYNNVPCHPSDPDCIGPLANSNQVDYYLPAGIIPLTGNVYARKKGLGIWDGLTLVTNQLSSPATICSPNYSINSAINALVGSLNSSSSLNGLVLECVLANNNGNGGNGGDDGNDGTIGGGGPRNVDVIGDFFDSFCLDENGFPRTCEDPMVGGDVLDPISEIIIRDLNTNNPPTILNVLENPNEFVFSLEPGLYSFGFAFKDGDFLEGIKEFKRDFSYEITREERSLITIDVFPTPITENQFQINMTPEATMSFKYELRDGNGRLLIDKTFEAEGGRNMEALISGIEIPRGLLFHVFRFQDGSIKTIKSFK